MCFEEVGVARCGGDGVGEGEGDGGGVVEEVVDEGAEAALGEAGDVFVDGYDAVEVDGLGGVVFLVDDFDFRVIDDEAAGLFLHFAVGDDLLAGGDDFGDEGHVEPAEGDFAGAEDAAGAVHDDGLVEAGFSEAFE